jgi:hypothetical protein
VKNSIILSFWEEGELFNMGGNEIILPLERLIRFSGALMALKTYI